MAIKKIINQKKAFKRLINTMQNDLEIMNKRVSKNYGIMGGYTEKEVKDLATTLFKIKKRFTKLKINL